LAQVEAGSWVGRQLLAAVVLWAAHLLLPVEEGPWVGRQILVAVVPLVAHPHPAAEPLAAHLLRVRLLAVGALWVAIRWAAVLWAGHRVPVVQMALAHRLRALRVQQVRQPSQPLLWP
jgi:hypothetical protein